MERLHSPACNPSACHIGQKIHSTQGDAKKAIQHCQTQPHKPHNQRPSHMHTQNYQCLKSCISQDLHSVDRERSQCYGASLNYLTKRFTTLIIPQSHLVITFFIVKVEIGKVLSYRQSSRKLLFIPQEIHLMHRIKQESCGKRAFLNADLNVTSNVLDNFKEEKNKQ